MEDIVRKKFRRITPTAKILKPTARGYRLYLLKSSGNKEELDEHIKDVLGDSLNYEKHVKHISRDDTELMSELKSMFDMGERSFMLPLGYDYIDNTCLYKKCLDGMYKAAMTQTDDPIEVLKYYIGRIGNPEQPVFINTNLIYPSKAM